MFHSFHQHDKLIDCCQIFDKMYLVNVAIASYQHPFYINAVTIEVGHTVIEKSTAYLHP